MSKTPLIYTHIGNTTTIEISWSFDMNANWERIHKIHKNM